MPDTDLLSITTDDSDEVINKKTKDPNLSQKSLKSKRSRLTFPFGAW